MIGYFAVISHIGSANDLIFSKDIKENNKSTGEIRSGSIYVKKSFLNKFENDKAFKEYEDIIVCFDGVILNLKELLNKYKSDNVGNLIRQFYLQNQLTELLSEFRGNFSGIVIQKNTKKLIAFTDQLAAKTLFYYQNKDYTVIATEVSSIVEFFRKNGIEYKLEHAGAYALISYGFMYGDYTLIDGVKRVREGSVLTISGSKMDIELYHVMQNKTICISEEEAIEKLDLLFRKAVQLQTEKNREYFYDDAAALSAGMDCRMTSYVLNEVSDRPVVNFTYSETGEYDCVVPAAMAKDMKNRWLFKSLDNGLDLMNIDNSIDIADGLIYYLWPAQLGDFLRMVNTSNWGIIHTGVLGDVVVGSFKKNDSQDKYYLGGGAFSTKFIKKLKTEVEADNYIGTDYELGMMRIRGINGACLGYSTTFRQYGEDMSPFCNIDFFDFCLSLPMEYRRDHRIYYDWVKLKYPKAARFKHNGININGKRTLKINGRNVRINAIVDLAVNKYKREHIPGYGMNPIQTWYETNAELKQTMDDYFNSEKSILHNLAPQIFEDAERLYQEGSAIEKTMAISLVGSVKKFFRNCEESH